MLTNLIITKERKVNTSNNSNGNIEARAPKSVKHDRSLRLNVLLSEMGIRMKDLLQQS